MLKIHSLLMHFVEINTYIKAHNNKNLFRIYYFEIFLYINIHEIQTVVKHYNMFYYSKCDNNKYMAPFSIATILSLSCTSLAIVAVLIFINSQTHSCCMPIIQLYGRLSFTTHRNFRSVEIY